MGDKWETSVNSCSPRHPDYETSVEDTCGRQVGDKCKIMRPNTPTVKDKYGKHVEDKCKLMRPKAPKCERQVGDKCKIMRRKAPRVKDKSGRQPGKQV